MTGFEVVSIVAENTASIHKPSGSADVSSAVMQTKVLVLKPPEGFRLANMLGLYVVDG